MTPSLSPFPPKLRNSESLACSSSSSTDFSSSSASSSYSAIFDRGSRTSSEWSDTTPPTSPSHSLEGAVKSMHGGQPTVRMHSKATFSEGLPTLLEDEEPDAAPYPTRLAKTQHSTDVRGAPRKAHPFLRTQRAELARNMEPRAVDKAVQPPPPPPQLVITSPDEDVQEWTESLQKRQDEALTLQADAVPSVEDNVPQDIEKNDASPSIESTIEAWLDQARMEGNEFPGVESLFDELFDLPSFPSDSDCSGSPTPQHSPLRSSTIFRPTLEPVPEDSVAPEVVEVVDDRLATFWVLEPLPSPSLATVPEEEEEEEEGEMHSPESMYTQYTQATTNGHSETGSILLDADVDFSMPPTPRINPMRLGDADFSPLILGSPKIRTAQTPSPRTPLSPRNRQDILHLASPLTISDDSNHAARVDVPAMMRLEIARTLANAHNFGQFTESVSGFGLGLELTSEETSLPSALFPSTIQLSSSSISLSSVHPSNDSVASDGPHHAIPSEAFEKSAVVDNEVVGLGLGKLVEAVLQSSSSVASKMDDECLVAELNEAYMPEQAPHSESRSYGRLEQRRAEAEKYELESRASVASSHQRLIMGSDATSVVLSDSSNSAVLESRPNLLTPRSALSPTRDAEQTSSSPLLSSLAPSGASGAPGPTSSVQVLYTKVRSSRLAAPPLSPIQEGDSTPEMSGIVTLDGDYGCIVVRDDVPSLLAEHPGAPRSPVQTTREVSSNSEQQVARPSAGFPPLNARSRGPRGALHPLLFVEPTAAELQSSSRGSDAKQAPPVPSTSTPLTGYPGISKIPAPRASQLEVEPHSFDVSISGQSSGRPLPSVPLAKGKEPLRWRSTGGPKVPKISKVEHAPLKNKKPAATKSAPAPVASSVPPTTSFLSRFGLHRPASAREYNDPALRMSIPSVLSARTDPRSPQVDGKNPVVAPTARKVAPTAAAGHNPPARSSSVKSAKTLGGLGKGLPSRLATRPPQPRNASTTSMRPMSSGVGTSAGGAASTTKCAVLEPAGSSRAQRSTSPPKAFLQIARFAKRTLYAIPEVPTPSPTFSASAGMSPVLQSPRKAGVLRRLLSPKKTQCVSPPPAASPPTAASKKSAVPLVMRSSLPQPQQLPSRHAAPLTAGRQPVATANPPSTTAVPDFQDLPAATDPGLSPLPFIEHADAPRNLGLFKRSPNRVGVEEASRTSMGSPLTRKIRCLF